MVFAPALALAGDLVSARDSGMRLAVLTMSFGLGLSAGQMMSGFLLPAGFLAPFAGLARHVFAVRVPGSEAGLEPAELARAAVRMQLSAEPVSSVQTALRLLEENWRYEPPPRVLICGSLYLAGDVLHQNQTTPA
jgi:hypothetical protein